MKPEKIARRPCTAIVVDHNSGVRRPCRSWAMHGSDPALCYAHRVRPGRREGPRPRHRRHLQLEAELGAEPEGELEAAPPRQLPPLAGEDAATSLALYRAFYDQSETAALLGMTDPASLAGEVATARIIIRRLLAYLTHENEAPADLLLRIAEMIFKGTGAVAHLVRDQTAGSVADDEAAFIAARNQALEELAEEWGLT